MTASLPPTDAERPGQRVLRRSRDDRMIGGVCGGIADYFGVDPTIVRLLFVVLVIAGGATIVAYLVLWLVVPEAAPGDDTGPGARARTASDELPHATWQAFGLVLLAVGATLLVAEVLPGLAHVLWPIALIVVGVALVIHGARPQ